METVNRIEYMVRDLNTRSVVLFPTRAQVVREMTAVNLKPATNKITVTGLSPTIEQESIKVEGGGSSVIITDVAVELLPNRDIFEEVYPDSSRDQADCDCNDQSDAVSDSDSGQEQRPERSFAQAKLQKIQEKLEIATERVDNATSRLKILESYASALQEEGRVGDINDELEKYRVLRDELFMERVERKKIQRGLREQLDKLQRQQVKEKAKEQKAKEKVRQEHEQKKSLKRKLDEERHKEQDRVRQERENFWPRYCYSVCITIECDSNTPLPSRSIGKAGVMRVSSPTSTEAGTVAPCSTCDLVLSYVTSSAGWAPSYDLQLSTKSSTAILRFDAQLINTTSETWSNCKVVLSTSQATFGGLDDVAPSLNPWKIKLEPTVSREKENQILTSREKSTHYTDWVASEKSNGVNKTRGEMFINSGLFVDALSDFEQSLMAEACFDTLYNLPGLRTLAPRSTPSKHRVDCLTFDKVMFSRMAVPKYRPVVYLKVKMRNTSKMSLLRGLAGLSLDGSFMGRKVLPRCSAGALFSLNLGVDPAVKIFYCKAEVGISTTEMFRKEIYARSITMQNIRAPADGPVSIKVRDQIPVSDDHCLRVKLLSPKVTTIDGPKVLVGSPGRDAIWDEDWGVATATATRDKTGEINWDVSLNAGKAVRLIMEYSVSFPHGEGAIQSWDS
ncbi:hypothetical protein J3459_013637 [Metarhizium acridum]|uniref:uncharacterized protein n=1 Tax=Metarhizium acridum TaxID=92637 RepID=UPI001C6BC671|nr:hypothetical protein J3458_013366 [Metarhizium acridum]KAG8416807.1 hypothetical protein J3459_013637 [Metarhizium acridum]